MNLHQQFQSIFKRTPVIQTKAPGRVNLIGEHTDYNDGFVMPIAIQYTACILAAPRNDNEVHVYSVDFQERASFVISHHIPFDKKNTWSNYQRGVMDQLIRHGYKLHGADCLIHGDVPIGAGLSSSAAIEMAAIVAFRSLNDLDISMVEMIRLSQAAENQFVGMNCGIMDQFISGMGQKGMALFLDCRSLDYELVPFPGDTYTVVIMNTRVKRELTGTEYNERRSQCEEGVQLLKKKLPGIQALRDVSIADFEMHKNCLPDIVRKRCHHVIYENERVRAFSEALKEKNTERMGQLLFKSHENLRDDYEVSCPELDLMVTLAMEVPGVIGARMTGAGFGGCAIAIVEKGHEKDVREKIFYEYPVKTGIEPEIYLSAPSQGASVTVL
ncbi:galactokinase [bacterium]|nr:galactokinase [bacterium]